MKKSIKNLVVWAMFWIALSFIITLFLGCEPDEPVIQEIESNAVITYVVKSRDPSQIIYCEFIDPEFGDVPQRVVISNLSGTPWTRNVIAKGDIEQYRIYFRYYCYVVTDTAYGEYGICVRFLDSDFTKEPSFSVDILVDSVSKFVACSGFWGLFPREDGLDWNSCRTYYISYETREYYRDLYREQLRIDSLDYIDCQIYLPIL